MIDWYKKVVLENYANFDGRARRAEFWNFILVNFLINISFYIITFLFGLISSTLAGIIGIISYIYSLAIIIPLIAAGARRLHDIGKSGWWQLIAFIPFGIIVLIVWLATDGTPGINEYGANPKEEFDVIEEIGIEEEIK